MWWEEHWIELATLVGLVGYFVRMEMFMRSVDERERSHHAAHEKRADDFDKRLRDLEREVHKRPPIREPHWKGGK